MYQVSSRSDIMDIEEVVKLDRGGVECWARFVDFDEDSASGVWEE